MDISSTTIDICDLLSSGFPRQAPNYVKVGGVRTAFSMPDVFSVGLSRGSIVRTNKAGNITVRPDLVGHFLTSKVLVFGRDVITSTDIIVTIGKEKIRDVDTVFSVVLKVVDNARRKIQTIL